jgi:hypothetical protein
MICEGFSVVEQEKTNAVPPPSLPPPTAAHLTSESDALCARLRLTTTSRFG